MEFCLRLGRDGHSWIESFAPSSPLCFLELHKGDHIGNTVVTRICQRLSNLSIYSDYAMPWGTPAGVCTPDHMAWLEQECPHLIIGHDFMSQEGHASARSSEQSIRAQHNPQFGGTLRFGD